MTCEHCGLIEAECRAMGCKPGLEAAMEPGTEQRKAAARDVIRALRSPMLLITRPDRERAIRIAQLYKLTAEELLAVAYEGALNDY